MCLVAHSPKNGESRPHLAVLDHLAAKIDSNRSSSLAQSTIPKYWGTLLQTHWKPPNIFVFVSAWSTNYCSQTLTSHFPTIAGIQWVFDITRASAWKFASGKQTKWYGWTMTSIHWDYSKKIDASLLLLSDSSFTIVFAGVGPNDEWHLSIDGNAHFQRTNHPKESRFHAPPTIMNYYPLWAIINYYQPAIIINNWPSKNSSWIVDHQSLGYVNRYL